MWFNNVTQQGYVGLCLPPVTVHLPGSASALDCGVPVYPQISPSPLWGALQGAEPFPLCWRRGSQEGVGGSHFAASESTVASGKVQLCLQVCAAHAGDHEAKAGVGDEAEQDTNDQAKCPSKFLLTSPSLAVSSSAHTE